MENIDSRGGKEENPFRRKESLKRTPPPKNGKEKKSKDLPTTDHERSPHRARSASFTCAAERTSNPNPGEMNLVSPSEKPSKRKRGEPKFEQPLESEADLESIIRKATGRSQELKWLTVANPDTSTDIKKAAEELWTLIGAMGKFVDNGQIPTKKGENAVTETATQTESTDDWTKAQEERKLVQKLWDDMKKGRSYEDFQAVATHNWPQSAYRRVKEGKGNLLTAPLDWDIAWCVADDLSPEPGVPDMLQQTYTKPMDLGSQGKNTGDVVYLRHSIGVPTGNGEIVNSDRFLYHLVVREKTNEVCLEKTFKAMYKLKELMTLHGRHRLALAKSFVSEWPTIKKQIEFVFAETEVEIRVYSPRDRNEATKNEAGKEWVVKNDQLRKREKRQTEAVFIKSNGKTYAELLRLVKKEVNPETSGSRVVGMRQAKTGELLLEVKGGKAESLREVIAKKLPDAEVRATNNDKIIHIRDIDAVTTAEEIVHSIKSTLESKEESIKVKNLRPAYGESQVATVALSISAANTLIQKGRIKIGWIQCRVRERIDLLRCYRCWQTGHNSAQCQGPDRQKLCLRCGQEGHKANICEKESFCPICSIKGHRADTGACPVFRKALEDARRANSQK